MARADGSSGTCETGASKAGALLASVQRPYDDDPDTRRGVEVRMTFSLRMLFLLIAVIIFVIAAFGVHVGDVSLVALGLAFVAAAFLVPEGILGRRA
jgi:uncharacterized membrane protein